MKIALAGNPNVGKTVLFNALTGSHQHVANFPGCTVERKEGEFTISKKKIIITDLPGTYSLSAYSQDEIVTREYLLENKPDLVINVIDASNLERNLFLTIQLMELGLPLLIVLNMVDVAKAKGFEYDLPKMKELLRAPVIPMVATTGEGLVELLDAILHYKTIKITRKSSIGFIREGIIKKYERKIVTILEEYFEGKKEKYHLNWIALKALEQDKVIIDYLDQIFLEKFTSQENKINSGWRKIKEIIADFYKELKIDDAAIYIATERYRIINEMISAIVITKGKPSTNVTTMLDTVLTDKYLGLPIFFASLWVIFQFTFTVSEPLTSWIEFGLDFLSTMIQTSGLPLELISLLNGAIDGVGSVIVFIPNIFLLYFAMALLEDSGYLARAAFVMDKWMEKVGIHGKSFIPLMLGFGCTVPAIMATRSIREKEDRLITIAIAPFMSCSARLTVYVLFAGIFFKEFYGLAIFSMYILGIIVAAVVAVLLNKFYYKHTDKAFILELPEFQRPQIRVALMEMWNQGSKFLRKAGTIIFGAAITVWLLSNIPFGAPIDQTLLAAIGKIITPLFLPFGWDWQFVTALLLGIMAKEIVVATLGVLFANGSLEQQIKLVLTPSQSIAYMVFILLYTPCVAAIAAIKSETGSIKMTIILSLFYIMVAYVVALMVFFVLKMIGIP